jgi:hypothetical protein
MVGPNETVLTTLDLPQVRNRASRPPPTASPVPSGTGMPFASLAVGPPASSATKEVEVVSLLTG